MQLLLDQISGGRAVSADRQHSLVERANRVLTLLSQHEVDGRNEAPGLLAELRGALAGDRSLGPVLGPLIARIRAALRKTESAGDPLIESWVSVGRGQLAVGHRPKLRQFNRLRAEGVTLILTLLSQNEGAREIGAAAGLLPENESS